MTRILEACVKLKRW